MIEASTLSFLSELATHNTKDWFDTNRKRYDHAKTNVIQVVDHIIDAITSFDGNLQGLDAKKCIFRINRDVRFSKNKDPYKINFGASMSQGGRKSPFAGYYLQIQPGQSFLGGGFYMPPSPVLKKIRHQIDLFPQKLREILADKDFIRVFEEIQGDELKTAPKGYPKDHPAVDLLRKKSFVVTRPITDQELQSEDFIDRVIADYHIMYPFLAYLNEGIGRIEETPNDSSMNDPLGLEGRI